jgi:hypothetical protein
MTPEASFRRSAILALLISSYTGLACGRTVAQLTDAGGNATGTGGSTGQGTNGGTSSGIGTSGQGNGTTGQASGGSTNAGITGSTSAGTGGIGSTGGPGGVAGTGSGTNGSGSTGGTGGSSGTGGGTTSGGMDGGLLNQACVITQGMDPCVAVGLVCRPSTDPMVMGLVCQVPGEFSPCQVSVGCNDPSLMCLSFFTGSYCLRPCTATGDCQVLYTTCQGSGSAQVCYFDFCGLSNDGGVFATCDAAGTGDGTCIPVQGGGGGGVCLQGGSVDAGDVCSGQRGPGITTANFCQTDSACIPGGVSGAGHCAPLCGLDAGPSCPSPTFCQPSGSGDWGYCL